MCQRHHPGRRGHHIPALPFRPAHRDSRLCHRTHVLLVHPVGRGSHLCHGIQALLFRPSHRDNRVHLECLAVPVGPDIRLYRRTQVLLLAPDNLGVQVRPWVPPGLLAHVYHRIPAFRHIPARPLVRADPADQVFRDSPVLPLIHAAPAPQESREALDVHRSQVAHHNRASLEVPAHP